MGLGACGGGLLLNIVYLFVQQIMEYAGISLIRSSYIVKPKKIKRGTQLSYRDRAVALPKVAGSREASWTGLSPNPCWFSLVLSSLSPLLQRREVWQKLRLCRNSLRRRNFCKEPCESFECDWFLHDPYSVEECFDVSLVNSKRTSSFPRTYWREISDIGSSSASWEIRKARK